VLFVGYGFLQGISPPWPLMLAARPSPPTPVRENATPFLLLLKTDTVVEFVKTGSGQQTHHQDNCS
jgi:hypothetical protein